MYTEDDRQYLQLMQANIERMANSSANCKTWMVTLVAAILGVGCTREDMGWLPLLAIVPIVVFWYLDQYYLCMERGMRNRQQVFLNIIKNSVVESTTYENSIYDFKPLLLGKEEPKRCLLKTKFLWFNKSVYPVYSVMVLVVIIVQILTTLI